MFRFPSGDLVPGPEEAGRATHGMACGKTKRVLKCRSWVLLEEELEQATSQNREHSTHCLGETE